MKHFFLLPVAALLSLACDPNPIYCDLSFQTVGFTWTDSTQVPDHVVAVIRETQDSLTTQFESTPGYYPVVTDEHRALFYTHVYHVDVYVYNELDSLMIQNEYVITADDCHIIKTSGPEYLP